MFQQQLTISILNDDLSGTLVHYNTIWSCTNDVESEGLRILLGFIINNSAIETSTAIASRDGNTGWNGTCDVICVCVCVWACVYVCGGVWVCVGGCMHNHAWMCVHRRLEGINNNLVNPMIHQSIDKSTNLPSSATAVPSTLSNCTTTSCKASLFKTTHIMKNSSLSSTVT